MHFLFGKRCGRLANRRAAGRAGICHVEEVKLQLATLLKSQRLTLKAEWRRRLCAEPVSTPLANPDVLVHLMDETLDQLAQLVQTQPAARWCTMHKVHLQPLRTFCPCGLNPLLNYFSTGGAALAMILSGAAGMSEREKPRLGAAWDFIAQQEIQALCGMCRRICAPALAFPLSAPEPILNDAAVRDKP